MKPLPGSGRFFVAFVDVSAILYALASRFATPVGVKERKILWGLKLVHVPKYKSSILFLF